VLQRLIKWLTPGIGIKRWLFMVLISIVIIDLGTAAILLKLVDAAQLEAFVLRLDWVSSAGFIGLGFAGVSLALVKLTRNLLAPYRRLRQDDVIDAVMEHKEHNRRTKGIKFVAIGGGTGLPAALRGMKDFTSNITAIVTVADDGGSSGRLRRDMGVAPPGDLRNNIAALADADSLLTQLFQYRFQSGDLQGHAFGNLFIAALANIVAEKTGGQNSLAEALIEVERILNIRGRVLPATLQDVTLTAQIRLNESGRSIKVRGESQIEDVEGMVETIELNPAEAVAYPESVKAIQEADMIVLGPGSLYTSILPNLLVKEIASALRAASGYKIYICNIATQPVETEGYTVAEHVMALERHIGRGVFQLVLANNAYPKQNAGENTRYVLPVPENHEILQRYEVRYVDLTDESRPWRHDPNKLAAAILGQTEQTR
jgi:uncharacterized cofD-like protein